jgi:hypothetical protein
VALRDHLQDLKTLDRQSVIALLHADTQKSFARKHMKDFEYLKWEIDPPLWVSLLAFVLSAVFSVGLSIYYSKNDVTFASLLEGILSLTSVFSRRGV